MSLKRDFEVLQKLYQQKIGENRQNPTEQENTCYGVKLRIILKRFPVTIDDTKFLKSVK